MGNSDSSYQKIIECNIIEHFNIELQEFGILSTESLDFDNAKIHFDFHNLKENIIGEIYAGIDELKAGQKQKIATDCLKMIAYEEFKKINFIKILVLVDTKIYERISKDSWLSKAIKVFGIKIKVIDLFKLKNGFKYSIEEHRKVKKKQGG